MLTNIYYTHHSYNTPPNDLQLASVYMATNREEHFMERRLDIRDYIAILDSARLFALPCHFFLSFFWALLGFTN